MLNYNYNYVIAIVIVIDVCNCVIRNVIELHLINILPCITLSNMARTVERIFSIGVKIFWPDWCSLTNKTFENLMLIKCN